MLCVWLLSIGLCCCVCYVVVWCDVGVGPCMGVLGWWDVVDVGGVYDATCVVCYGFVYVDVSCCWCRVCALLVVC